MFTIGCDPEFFLLKNNLPQSAIGLVGGTKEEPKAIGRTKGFSVQEDNVSVEFNVPPAHSHEEFIKNIQFVMTHLKKKLKDYDFSHDSSLIFDDDQLRHPKAMEFGCEPDFNAWTKQINPRPVAQNLNLRSAGGHVHVGTKEDPIEVIRAMDLFLGVESIVKDKNGERRRELYGKPGAYRLTSFGCEYRTLSNFWIFSKETIKWVYDQTQKAVEFVSGGDVIDPKHGEIIQHCINKSDMGAYEYLRDAYGLN
jgi:hypothetical protein